MAKSSRLQKLSTKKPSVATAQLVTDPLLVRALERARLEGSDDEVAELEAKVTEATVTFAFRSIGRRALEALRLAHPPTDEDKAEAERHGVDPAVLPWAETFEPALLAACLIPEEGEDPLTAEDFAELYESENWNAAELRSLFGTALSVNQTNSIEALGKG